MALVVAAGIVIALSGWVQEPPETTGAGEGCEDAGACAGCCRLPPELELPSELEVLELAAPEDCVADEVAPVLL